MLAFPPGEEKVLLNSAIEDKCIRIKRLFFFGENKKNINFTIVPHFDIGFESNEILFKYLFLMVASISNAPMFEILKMKKKSCNLLLKINVN